MSTASSIARTLGRQLAIDSALRWSMLAGVLLAIFGAVIWPNVPNLFWNGLLLALAVIWVIAATISARMAQQLPMIESLIEHDPKTAETQLEAGLSRRMLPRPVRLLLYHQLAGLRHRQQRFEETVAICQAVLMYMTAKADAYRLPGITQAGRHVRVQVLLLLAESQLQQRDIGGAWQTLASLHGCTMNLTESLQRLALQTQYEVAAGYDEAALHQLDRKVALAELMPAAQCGAIHAMLGVAARRKQQTQLAKWLAQRAALLCTPQQLETFMQQLHAAMLQKDAAAA